MRFNAVLDGCARKQMTSLAGHILSDMESSGIAPSSHTLGTQMCPAQWMAGGGDCCDTKSRTTLRLQEVDGR